MNISQIQDTLHKLYIEEKHRLIFWYDTDAEFQDILPSLDLQDIDILRVDEEGSLSLKIKLELEDREGKYLVYAPYVEPAPEGDWLLDIKLYSHIFYADRASIILNELGLTSQSLRPYLNKRKNFFRSQDRQNRLQKWISSDDNEDTLDLKMLTVLTKADHPNFFSILMKLIGTFCSDDTFNSGAESKPWEEINKFGLVESFWKLIQQNFGYIADEPQISDFLIRILVTDFTNNLKADPPNGLTHFILPQGSQRQNVSVFLSQWRTTIGQFQNFNTISKYYGKSLKIEEVLAPYEPEDLIDIPTFDAVERRIISSLKNTILKFPDEFESVLSVIRRRRDSHWLTTTIGKEQTNLYPVTYDALESAISLFQLRQKYDSGISYPTAKEMFSAYTSELFKFDQFYRQFHESAEQVELGGWDVLKNLASAIDDLYSDWYMDQLAVAWDGFMEPSSGEGLLDKWSFYTPYNQYQFYDRHVKKELQNKSRSRVFVIISDAFRYEVAEELTREINSKYRLKAELEPMLGVLPSYTSLGMASLLPHKKLSYKANGDVLVDDKPTASLEQRSDILSAKNGIAIKADDLTAMSKSQGRNFVKPYEVIYIYHNQIDALGDKTVTESKTFSATRTAINEVSSLVRFLINNLNGSYIVATADHGFIYQEKDPAHTDKSVLPEKPDGTVKAKKRYIIGKDLGDTPKAWHGNMAVTAKAEGDMEFLIPKGTNRFHFKGGAKFFHGGAMLQEIAVPVVTIKELRGSERLKSQVSKVGVSLLGANKKIVTNRHRFEFIQTDKVSDRMLPQTLLISLRDVNTLISNEEMVTFDSTSSEMDERKKSVMLMLKSAQYDNKKEYHLVLRDAETEIEHERYPVTIDLALVSDF